MINKDTVLKFWQGLDFKYKIGIIIVLGMLVLWFMLSPKIDKIKKARSELTGLKNKVNKKRLKLVNINKEVKKIPQLEKELRNIKNTLKKFNRRLISGDERTKLINILTFKEQEIEYSFFNIKISQKYTGEEKEKFYKKYPIEITLYSTYLLLGKYLRYIEDINFAIGIKEITVNKVKDSYNNIETKLKLVAYVAK